MKLWVSIFGMICVVSMFAFFLMKSDIISKEPSLGRIGNSFSDVKIQEQEKMLKSIGTLRKEDFKKAQVFKGNLILINEEHPVHQASVKSDVITLTDYQDLFDGIGFYDRNIQLSRSIGESFMDMVRAAGEEGYTHFLITSGYRGFEEQNQLYKEMGPDYALPAGYSEHNSGLALDVGSQQGEMTNAPEGKWIEHNAWKYGFVLRYPKNKSTITGIEYEPWHIRYVGLPHSAVMHKKRMVLEEYLEYLKTEKNLDVTYDGQEYLITYYPFSEGQQLKVPDQGEYQVSGDNTDGVIVTIPK
ncbi:M15 family metallopeptidase [Halobacillus salinarum]|uniref:M15 family metallopeptidase n=1 Tax=Halobacillus salinarum TaxID=2932257 RepID=A0ABY4EJS4_9BACI|nr:M15 family metallopeptidase [Halobacillus salinarum]UOQ44724.1 M15 family metallopeptidase [Halobacillus salinarum]